MIGERAFKHNPADAHDARPAGSVIPFNRSVELLCLLQVQRTDYQREKLLNITQLMLMMLALRAP